MNKKENKSKVWISVEDLTNDTSIIETQQNEFAHTEETGKNDHSRRDFLKYMGFGLGAATVASCEIPVKKAIPYVIKPEEIVPGVATYFATAIVQSGNVLPALVKTREGRPIKIEGNPGVGQNKTFTAGGTCAKTQASVLELYDTNRVKGPGAIEKMLASATDMMSWADLDKAVVAGLSGQIRVVTHTNNSPSFKAAFETFKAKYAGAQLVQYDPISCSANIEANERMYGNPWLPAYHFDKAMCIVGIEADFLGTWVSPVEFSKDYIKNRKVTDADIKNGADKAMSTHIQFESRMSLTGSNADHRVLVKPSEWGAAVGALYTEVANLTGAGSGSLSFQPKFAWSKAAKAIKDTAKKLVDNNRKALVVCGINDVNIQMVVNAINEMLGAPNSTMTLSKDMHSKQRLGRDGAIQSLVKDMESGAVNAVIVCDGANPAYDLPGLAGAFAKGLEKVAMSVSLGGTLNETAAKCKYIAPDHHNLESWGDAEPIKGQIYVVQPTISPLFKTRAAGESLLTWAGNNDSYHKFMQKTWQANMFPAQSSYMTFQSFWNNTLHDGWFTASGDVTANVEAPIVEEVVEQPEVVEADPLAEPEPTPAVGGSNVSAALAALTQGKSGAIEVTFYESVQLGAGQHANNPWLQEMPDPIMRTTWDNFIQIPIKWDGNYGYESLNNLQDGDFATINVNGADYTLPVFRQFGQMQGTVSIALGYGRTRAGKAGNGVGKDLFPAVKDFNYSGVGTVSEYQGHDDLYACVQMHHTYGITTTDESGATKMHKYKTGEERVFNVDEHIDSFQSALVDRSVFFHATTGDVKAETERLAKKRKNYQYLNSKGLYPDRSDFYGMGHHWGMTVDLNSCTGCGACTVACMAENNVPVVGKYEVNNVHEMTWLRIDRYFYGNEETPNTVYMPLMCQHCDNAPCENVCPVAATNHSSEGINQMTYNRCVGTRYCANNCPFKVRRFNWLDYTSADIFPSNEVDMNRGIEGGESYNYMNENLTRMVLNPDVTVRSRGVIEKCSFCIQRIQEGKLAAKVEGRKLQDADVTPACQQACSTGAIIFGDDNNRDSEVYKLQQTKRSYIALEETNVRSSINYLMKVINKDEKFA